MPLYLCSDPAHISEIVPALETASSRAWRCTWFVYVSKDGPTGFDRDGEGFAHGWRLARGGLLLRRAQGTWDRLGEEAGYLESVRSQTRPVALMVGGPSGQLLLRLRQLESHLRSIRSDELRARYGRSPRHVEEPDLAALLGPPTEWSQAALRTVLQGANRVLLWRLGGGEHGLHCLSLSSAESPAWEGDIERNDRGGRVVRVASFDQIPAW
jgi:hypothetical protein